MSGQPNDISEEKDILQRLKERAGVKRAKQVSEMADQREPAEERPDYRTAYRRNVLSILGGMMNDAHQPDLSMDEAAAKEWLRERIWLGLKVQDYGYQSQDVEVIAEHDAFLAVISEIYRVLFRQNHNVELGPTFILQPVGESVWVQDYETAEAVRKAMAEPTVTMPSHDEQAVHDILKRAVTEVNKVTGHHE